jgi:hypothetical protein
MQLREPKISTSGVFGIGHDPHHPTSRIAKPDENPTKLANYNESLDDQRKPSHQIFERYHRLNKLIDDQKNKNKKKENKMVGLTLI